MTAPRPSRPSRPLRWLSVPLLLACGVLALMVGCRASPADDGAPSAEPVAADLLFVGGPVHTVEPGAEPASALAVVGRRIAWVGDAADAQAWRGAHTRVIDLAGRALLPGLADAHLHLEGFGHQLERVDLVDTPSYEAVIAAVAEAAAEQAPGTWIVGRGWDQNDWPEPVMPHHRALSEAVPDHPVVLDRIDGHAVLVNAAALALAGVGVETSAPPGGRILRDDDGAPTGVLVDAAEGLVTAHVPPPSREQRKAALARAVTVLNGRGLTAVHDAGTDALGIELAAELAAEGRFTLRDHVMVSAHEPALRDPAATTDWPSDDLTGQGLIKVRAIKHYADGALGSRGALLLDDYSDEPGTRGLPVSTREEILTVARLAAADGWQLATHAIGDGGNRLVLDVYAEVLADLPQDADPRWRVEHAQVLHPDDIPRFAELGVLPSMQAQHLTSDMPWAADRLGSQRLAGAYAWRSLLDTGVPVVGGSDAPVERAEPLHALAAAVTRAGPDGRPEGGWDRSQAMTREEALAHMTRWPAFAAFDEQRLGTLTPGKLADLVVLDGDPLTVPEDQLAGLGVELTVFDGRVVHERDGSGR